jgi:hypothetical protein
MGWKDGKAKTPRNVSEGMVNMTRDAVEDARPSPESLFPNAPQILPEVELPVSVLSAVDHGFRVIVPKTGFAVPPMSDTMR